VGEASEPTPRPNPSNGNTSTHKYRQAPLEGKRDLYMVAGILLIIGIFINIATLISYALMYLALGKPLRDTARQNNKLKVAANPHKHRSELGRHRR
jgi:hypothetical protein